MLELPITVRNKVYTMGMRNLLCSFRDSSVAVKLSVWICISVLFDSCGDRAWNYLVGIYLTKLTPLHKNSQLSSIYGLLLTFTTIAFSPLVGKWIDRTNRLRVVRILLLLQNILFVLSAALIPVCLRFFVAPSALRTCLHGIIVLVGALSNLANLGVKVSVSRDWLVVVCRKDNDHLAKANTLRRVLDLLIGVGAPVGTAALLDLMSDTAGVFFICSLNTGTKFIEYLILHYVYRRDISLAEKKEGGSTGFSEPSAKGIAPLDELGDVNQGIDYYDEEEGVKQTSVEQLDKKEEPTTDDFRATVRPDPGQKIRVWLLGCVTGWITYKKQSIALAGLALSLLYTNILNFHAITASYAYSVGFKKLYLSIGFGLGNLFGFLGAVIFPFIRTRVGLPKTGLVGNVIQLSFLSLCVLSVWLPGSPASFLHHTRDHYTPHVPSTNPLTRPVPTSPTTTHTAKPAYSSMQMTNSSTPYSQSPSSTHSTHTDDSGINISVLTLCIGIITSRPGLWIADLTITQLQQEYVPELERGLIGGVQNALNSVFDLVHYGISVGIPEPGQFWILIFLSVFAVFVSFVLYIVFNVKFQGRQVTPVDAESSREENRE